MQARYAEWKQLGSDRVANAPRNALTLPILNLISFIVVVVLNSLGSAGAIGAPVQEVSDRLPTLITPAGWTFAIWGFIYAAQAVFVVYSLMPTQRGSPVVARLSVVFALNCLVNALWILMWVLELGDYWPSVGLMLCILASNIAMYLLIDVNYGAIRWTQHLRWPGGEVSTWTPWQTGIYQTWISLYLAWISVATVANIAGALVHSGAPIGWSPEALSVFFQCVVFTLAATNLLWRKDWVFGLAAAWALLGVATAFNGIGLTGTSPGQITNITSIGNATVVTAVEAATVSTGAFVCSALILMLSLQTMLRLIVKRYRPTVLETMWNDTKNKV